MRIKRKQKMHKVCSLDEGRPYINHVYFDGENFVASDGHCLVRIPPEATSVKDKKGFISRKCWKRIAQGENSTAILGKKFVRFQDGDMCLRPDGGSFPGYESLIPTGEPTTVLQFNAESLYRIAEAMGSHRIKLEVHGAFGGVLLKIVPLDEDNQDGSFGLLMPIAAKPHEPDVIEKVGPGEEI